MTLNYDVLNNENAMWTTGVILSTYRTVLDEYIVENQTLGNLGAPGQNGTNMILVQEGEEIGQIWGPLFNGVGEAGAPTFVDINGDGQIIAGQDQALNPDADFAVLGNGIPDLEFGWTNQLSFGDWNVNAFFRGAFGHSLVNTFRAFYEPRIASQGSYNYVNTELAVPGLTTAQFSDLYVEKADFFKLDNLTVSRSFTFDNSKYVRGMTLSLTGQNLFVITNYTGADPEPALSDVGTADNGGEPANVDNPDVLAPGIDRRNTWLRTRTIAFGVNLGF